ncbi:hypothetical protein AYI75_20375 [Shewanella algae]|nr:hypothetical protein AYI75_20375 [Shewanella algae]
MTLAAAVKPATGCDLGQIEQNWGNYPLFSGKSHCWPRLLATEGNLVPAPEKRTKEANQRSEQARIRI